MAVKRNPKSHLPIFTVVFHTYQYLPILDIKDLYKISFAILSPTLGSLATIYCRICPVILCVAHRATLTSLLH